MIKFFLTGIITIDDFKCIFCFELPQCPKDKYRGIVVCPNCKRPAHINEFLDWSRNSPYCSLCEAEYPQASVGTLK